MLHTTYTRYTGVATYSGRGIINTMANPTRTVLEANEIKEVGKMVDSGTY